jgi:hypothetical protein
MWLRILQLETFCLIKLPFLLRFYQQYWLFNLAFIHIFNKNNILTLD